MTAQPQGFDPVQFKQTTREQWERVAEAWHRWGPTLQDWLGPVTEAMLELTQIRPGDRVLDVAAGAGEPALSAAARVGPSGFVLATDLSATLVGFAAQLARERGLGPTQFETRTMDGEHLVLADASFDIALSRLGLVYFPDRLGALTEMHRVLKPGGRVAIASFTTPEANRFFSIPIGIIRRRAHLPPPPPGLPGPFSLGLQEVMEGALRQAEFRDIQTRTIRTPLRLPSTAECVRFERESFGALQQMLVGLAEAEREATWDEIERELRQFQAQHGFAAPTELIVGAGTKEAAFLVTGNPGSGKSTLAQELARRELATIDPDDDPALAYWEDDAGNRGARAEDPAAPDEPWLRAHRWVWNRSRLHDLLTQQPGPVFVCGIALNIDHVLDLFDRLFLLRIDADTQEERLLAYDTSHPPGRTAAGRQPGFVVLADGQPITAMVVEVTNERVQTIHLIANPDKLGGLPLSGPSRNPAIIPTVGPRHQWSSSLA